MPFDYKNEYERYKKYYQSLDETIQKPKNRIYTATVFSFLAVSLFGWYAIRPTAQTILYLRREIADNQMVNQRMEEKISALVEAQSAYQTVQPQLPLVNQALPRDPDVIALVGQLRNLAMSSGASLSGITVPTVSLTGEDATRSGSGASRASTIVKAAKLNDFPVTVMLDGSFPTVQSFLQGITSMRRIITIDTFSIAPSREAGATNMLQLTLKLKGYYLTQ